MYACYILYSQTLETFYVGESESVEDRLKQHNSGLFDRAFTSQATDWTIFLVLNCNDRGHARRIESHIKEMKSKVYFRNLEKYPEMREKLILRFANGSGSR
jgi:putative endonuclease